MARQGEVGHVLEVGGGKFEKYHEGGTASVSHELYPTKSGYITFDPVGVFTINWRPTGGQV